jgi:hypothetical protein
MYLFHSLINVVTELALKLLCQIASKELALTFVAFAVHSAAVLITCLIDICNSTDMIYLQHYC